MEVSSHCFPETTSDRFATAPAAAHDLPRVHSTPKTPRRRKLVQGSLNQGSISRSLRCTRQHYARFEPALPGSHLITSVSNQRTTLPILCQNPPGVFAINLNVSKNWKNRPFPEALSEANREKSKICSLIISHHQPPSIPLQSSTT